MNKSKGKTSNPQVSTGDTFVGTICVHNWTPQVTVEYKFREAEREYNETDLVVKRVFCTKCLELREITE